MHTLYRYFFYFFYTLRTVSCTCKQFQEFPFPHALAVFKSACSSLYFLRAPFERLPPRPVLYASHMPRSSG